MYVYITFIFTIITDMYSSGNNFFLFENLLFLRISYRSYEVNTPKKQFYIYIIIYKEVFTSTCISD